MKIREKAVIALILSITGWSLSPVFIRYLQDAYDPYTQSGVRYMGAVLFILPYCWLFHREDLILAFARPVPTLILSMINIIMQATWTIGIYYSTASLGQILVKIQIPIVAIFSFIMFAEERSMIKNLRFILGLFMALVGSVILVYKPASLQDFPRLYYAVVSLFISAFLWGFYSVYGKYTVSNELHPVPMFAVISIYTTLGLLGLGLIIGEPEKLLTASFTTHLLALFSGILPIAIAHSAFHYSQLYLGSAFTNTLLTLTPLITHFIALILWENERLSVFQWFGTIILLLGCLLVVLVRRNEHSEFAIKEAE